MANSRTDYQPVEWTAAMQVRLRKLWFAYYRTAHIAEILGISQAAVVVEAKKLWLGYRAPGDLYKKHKPDPTLEVWGKEPLRVPPKEMPRQLQRHVEAPRQARLLTQSERQGQPVEPQRQDQSSSSRPKPPWDDVVSLPKPVIVAPPKLKPPRRPKGFYATKKVTKMFDEWDEQAKIDEFLRTKGATRCPPAFVAPTQTELQGSEEQARLKAVVLPEKMTREEALAARKRVSSKQRQWYEARQAAAMRQTRRNST